ncbi:metallophosphoesterase [Salinimicrobium marinum]|uniref:Metallophosphoesterase n=1 Tax=Salinimicrobium marinum TaxID=680283 RepID=A0A918VX50_9FLAO|nr:metallophosphoesterase [Salinimicrobium marinum]GHA37893.1 metallophosphoesterase [Salinimicrobium marinum]
MKTKLLLLILFTICQASAQGNSTEIAFLADVHFQDLYGDLEDSDYPGVLNPGSNSYTLVRTMASQLHSTRIFNENYFALLAALDDITQRNIKLVALPGDYTDDGQPVHLRGLSEILNHYTKTYKIQFFITTGNHDPVGPFAQEAGKNDFLGEQGKNQPIYSGDSKYIRNPEVEHPVVVTRDIAKMGYVEVMEILKEFGFFPKKRFLYWETPFSSYDPENYEFAKALYSSRIENRTYLLKDSLRIPDASYLVEPVDGLWLLAIDGNTYVPQKNGELSGAGIGYNNTIEYKRHLFQWIRKVAENARRLNKKLVAFSHYPAIDFNEDESPRLREFLGPNKWQLERVPQERIAKALAEAGVKLHFAGHMHINDTGKRAYGNGEFLVNIQTPSLAAYIPGYKILTITDNTAEVETIVIEEVPGFNELFPLYQMEHKYLNESGQPVWNDTILQSRSYREFAQSHLENLVTLRFLNDWSPGYRKFLSDLSGKEILRLSQYRGDFDQLDFLNNDKDISEIGNQLENPGDYESWTGEDMILDFYKIRNADKLAFKDIPKNRLDQYRIILDGFHNNPSLKAAENEYTHKLYLFTSIFRSLMKGLPASHFKIDLETGEITDLVKN